MIKRIIIENFKSLRKVELNLGRMNLFIGANASGKSNLFDALRVLQGIGYGFTIREILDGKPKSAMSVEWQAIRGGSAFARFREDGTELGENVRFQIALSRKNPAGPDVQYVVAFNPLSGQVNEERLILGDRAIYDSAEARNEPASPVLRAKYERPAGKGNKPRWEFERWRPVLGQIVRKKISKEHSDVCEEVAEAFGDTQRLDPQPEILRSYSQAQQISRMGERGENFAGLVKTICENPATKESFTSWLRELRPSEVEEVTTLAGALGEPLFALKERSKEFPAPVLSDGTLRFSAITAAFFQPDMPAILTIEEIEKGIHASRLRLLLELLKSQAGQGKIQVMATTHSRSVLDWLDPEDFTTTFLCQRDLQTGESRIVPLTQVPHFLEAVEKESLGDLFAENWLEAAL